MVLVADREPAEVEKPGKEAVVFPSATVPPQRSPILRRVSLGASMRSSHLHAGQSQLMVPAIAVIGAVTARSPIRRCGSASV